MSDHALNRREFVTLLGGGLVASSLAGPLACAAEADARRPSAPFLLSTVSSGRATAYAEASKIVTLGGNTHVHGEPPKPGKVLRNKPHIIFWLNAR